MEYEELQDYKVKSVKSYKIIFVWRGKVTRLQKESRVQKSFREREKESYYKVFLKFGPQNWTCLLSSESVYL